MPNTDLVVEINITALDHVDISIAFEDELEFTPCRYSVITLIEWIVFAGDVKSAVYIFVAQAITEAGVDEKIFAVWIKLPITDRSINTSAAKCERRVERN